MIGKLRQGLPRSLQLELQIKTSNTAWRAPSCQIASSQQPSELDSFIRIFT